MLIHRASKRIEVILLMTSKIIHNYAPKYLTELLESYSPPAYSTIWISKPTSSTTIFHNYIWGQGIFHSSTKIMEQSTSDS